jgi:hypothetical protein
LGAITVIGFSKEAQTKHSPGGKGTMKERKGIVSNAEKGAAFEKELLIDHLKLTGKIGKRNNQRLPGGGLSCADITTLPGFHFECKDEQNIRIRAYIAQGFQDCPKHHRLAIRLRIDGRKWTLLQDEHLLDHACSLIQEMGGIVEF